MKNIIWISFEDDFPSWSDYIVDQEQKEIVENYVKNLITAIEWCCNKKVKALKIESVDNNKEPLFQVVK